MVNQNQGWTNLLTDTVLQVFQVLNDKKQLYAVKYVNLEEADQQTVESYKNEIAHLSKLQQHSDKIIRLYGQ